MSTVTDALGATLTLPDTGPAPDPQPGDYWVLSTDNHDRAVILVSATGRGGHVLAWPVTAATFEGGYPTFTDQLEGQEVTVWPEMEFGLSLVTLDRVIGRGPGTRIMRAVVAAIEDGEPLPTLGAANLDGPGAIDALDRVCRQAWELAELEWPRAVIGEGVLNNDFLHEHAITATLLREVLQVEPGRAADLAGAFTIPTPAEADAVAALTETSLGVEVLAPAAGPEVDALSAPTVKADIRELTVHLNISESLARTTVLVQALHAARQAPGEAQDQVRARVQHALDDLLDRR